MYPTTSTKDVLITEDTEDHEEIYVATFDIPGEYIYTETDKEVVMILEGPLSKFILKLDTKLYSKHVTINS